MNYYNPYLYMMPAAAPKVGLFSRLFGGGIKWSSILNGTQRTLSILNQGIPLVRQVSPIVRNAKTMFKVMNEFKKVDTTNINNNNNYTTNTNYESDYNTNYTPSQAPTNNKVEYIDGPTFFV